MPEDIHLKQGVEEISRSLLLALKMILAWEVVIYFFHYAFAKLVLSLVYKGKLLGADFVLDKPTMSLPGGWSPKKHASWTATAGQVFRVSE